MVELAGNAERHRKIEMADPQAVDAIDRGDGIGILGAFRRFDLAEQRGALVGGRELFRHRSRRGNCHAPRCSATPRLPIGIILHAIDDRPCASSAVADHREHDALRAHVAGARDVVVFLRRHAHDGRQVGRLEIADGALHRFEAEARMLKVEEHEIAARRFQDVADARRGKFDDEMAELDVPVAGHGLQVVTRHFFFHLMSQRRMRTFAGQIVLGDSLGDNERFAFAVEHIEMRGLEMGVEGGAVIIDFIEEDPVAGLAWHQHVKALAARLIGAGVLGVLVDELAEGRHGAGLQREINGDDKAAHRVASRTFQ